MEHLVDVDDLAARLAPHVSRWSAHASVGPFTWRDGTATWPQPILTDRAAVAVPESVGFMIETDTGRVLTIVVWTGGWADIEMFTGSDVLTPHHEFRDADEALAVVLSTVEDFLA